MRGWHIFTYLSLLLLFAWITYSCIMERPWLTRAELPFSDYSAFPKRRPTTLSLCNTSVATTDFAFVAFLSSLTEKVCFLACFERYVKGAIVLARSIRRVTNLNMVLMVTGEARDIMSPRTRAALVNEGWTICAVDAIGSPKTAPHPNRFILGLLYTKLTVWKFTEYKAVMTLDLDMMVLRDPTDIFTQVLPKMLAANKTLGAVVDRPGPGSIVLDKCGKQWTDTPTFNSGTLLVIPSVDTFRRLVNGIDTVPHDTGTGDQGFLNAMYNPSSFYPLPFAYNGNMRSILCEPHVWRRNGVKILHFNVEKPWGFARLDLVDAHGLVPYMLLWASVLEQAPESMEHQGSLDRILFT